VASPEYYHRQADLCLRMALLASEYGERLRLLDIANGYRDDAVRVEALQGASHAKALTVVGGSLDKPQQIRDRTKRKKFHRSLQIGGGCGGGGG
jgi:hypothetical protein